jgi:hypothetical protein
LSGHEVQEGIHSPATEGRNIQECHIIPNTLIRLEGRIADRRRLLFT